MTPFGCLVSTDLCVCVCVCEFEVSDVVECIHHLFITQNKFSTSMNTHAHPSPRKSF